MQTFLPFADFAHTAQVLDRQRLGKQRVETLQIVTALVKGGGWENHPAVKMWRGHLFALVAYQRAICFEWRVKRGYKDTCLDKTIELAGTIGGTGIVRPGDAEAPPWLGNRAFHLSHQSNLLRKLPEHYQPYWPTVGPHLKYVWPVS